MATDLRVDAGPARSFGSLLQDLGFSVTRMARAELRLAAAEARDELSAIGSATLMLGVGVLTATLAVGFLLLAAAVALTSVLPPWAAALSIGAAVAVVAALLLTRAASRWSQIAATRGNGALEPPS